MIASASAFPYNLVSNGRWILHWEDTEKSGVLWKNQSVFRQFICDKYTKKFVQGKEMAYSPE